MQSEIVTWATFLGLLQNAYMQVAIGVVWFLLWEYIPEVLRAVGLNPGWFEELEQYPKRKRIVVALVAISVPVGAYLLEVLTVTGGPVYWDSSLVVGAEVGKGLWYAIFAGLGSVGSATAIHTTKLASYKFIEVGDNRV